MTPKLKFAEGEKVLCFHGPLIYEAKALKYVITKEKQVKYYIHYAGWNKNWDEWVPENRVLKYNEINVQRQQEVQKIHGKSSGKKRNAKGKKGEVSSTPSKDGAGSSESRASTPSKDISSTSLVAPTSVRINRSKQIASTCTSKETDIPNKKDDIKEENKTDDSVLEEPHKKKRGGSSSNVSEKSFSIHSTTPTPHTSSSARVESNVINEESFLSKTDVKIKIPDELKQCLADDWDAVTRQHKLHDIPAKTTVQDIVDQYIVFRKTSKAVHSSAEVPINDVLNGITEYFNVMLGSQLLYKFERQQYAEILQQHSETPLSKLYGAFHLLRLFVKLGSMLSFSALDEKSMQLVLNHLNDFLKYLVKNNVTYFNMTSFVNVSLEYHRNTQ